MDMEQSILDALLAKVDIEAMVQGVIEAEVRDTVRSEARSQLRDIVNKRIGTIVEAEIAKILDGGEIGTDDGWGKKETYQNFEVLFKAEFKKKLENAYEMKNTISRSVKDRIDQLMTKEFNATINKVVEELVKIKTKEQP
jgi:chromosome condensin MukBEF complex kleisin-like MukF subunit